MVNHCLLAQQKKIHLLLKKTLHLATEADRLAMEIDHHVTVTDRLAMETDHQVKVRPIRQEMATGRLAMEAGRRIKVGRAERVLQETATDLRIKADRAEHVPQEMAIGLHIKAVRAHRIKVGRAEHVPVDRKLAVVRVEHREVAVQLLVAAAPGVHRVVHVEKMIKNPKRQAQETINAIFGAVSNIFKRPAIKKIKKMLLAKKIAKLWIAAQEAVNLLQKNYRQNVSSRMYH